MDKSAKSAAPKIDMNNLKATSEGLMKRGYFKWGIYGTAILFVLQFVNLIPFLNCITIPVSCLLVPALYVYIAYRGSQESMVTEKISNPQTMDYIKFGIFTAFVGAIGAVVGSIISTILRSVFSIAASTATTNLLSKNLGSLGSIQSAGVSAGVGIVSVITGAICGIFVSAIIAAVFGALGGFIAQWMANKDKAPAQPAAK